MKTKKSERKGQANSRIANEWVVSRSVGFCSESVHENKEKPSTAVSFRLFLVQTSFNAAQAETRTAVRIFTPRHQVCCPLPSRRRREAQERGEPHGSPRRRLRLRGGTYCSVARQPHQKHIATSHRKLINIMTLPVISTSRATSNEQMMNFVV